MNKRKLIQYIFQISALVLMALIISFPVYGRTIRYEGLTPQFITILKKKFPVLSSQKISHSDTDQVIRYIMKNSTFKSVAVYQETANSFIISAKAVRKIVKIEVVGNNYLSNWKIQTLLKLKEGDVFDKLKVIQAGERLKEHYGHSGYFNSVISAAFEPKGKYGQIIYFKIKENEPCVIKTISVLSENKVLEDRIRSRFNRFKNKAFTELIIDKISDTANDYFKKYRYIKGNLKQTSVVYNKNKTEAHLNYKVEYPYQFEIYFEGNKTLSKSDLFRTTRLLTISKDTLNPAREIVGKIRQKYLKIGFANIRINYDVAEDNNKFKRKIHIKISEGKKIKIGSLKFSGHISRPSKYYSDFIFSNSTELVSRKYYNREDLKISYDNLTIDLKNQGFLHAKIRSIRLDYNKKKDKANIAVDLDEGPLTQVRKIRFKGIKAFQKIELGKLLLVSNNSPLHLQDLELSLIELKKHYKSHGYMEVSISDKRESLIKYNKSETQADIFFNIYEGPRVTIEGIQIEGNVHVHDSVILRESEFKKGDILTPDSILEAVARLNKLGVFSNVEIDTNNKFTSLSKRTLIIKLVERKPGLFKIGAGFTDENELTIHGFSGVSYIWGSTRAISSRAEISESITEAQFLENKIAVGYLEPFLYNTSWKGRINITRREKVDQYFPDQNKVSTILVSNKLAFLLEKNITAKFKFIWNLWTKENNRSYLDGSVANFDIDDPGTPEIEVFKSSTQNIATIGPTLDYEARDNPFLPTKGHLLRLSLDYSDPHIGSTPKIHFIRVQAQANKYIKFGSRVWANSFRWGYGKNLGSDSDGSGIPTSHAFFLGGLSTVRGFGGNSTHETIPNGEELPLVQGSNDLIIPDTTRFFLIKSEFRFPVWDNFGLALFYDGGSVSIAQKIPFENSYRQAVGVGFRYNTPVGPVSLDIGFKIAPRKDEDKFRIHFSFGTF